MKFKNNHLLKAGFTLLELLVVILILGILAAFVAPNIIGTGEKARRDLVCSQMSTVEQTLNMFKLDNSFILIQKKDYKSLNK